MCGSEYSIEPLVVAAKLTFILISQVERAIGAWFTGQPVYTDSNRFSATAWQDTTCRHLLGIKQSTYRFSMILRATATITKKAKDAGNETLASQSTDPRINVGHSDPPEL